MKTINSSIIHLLTIFIWLYSSAGFTAPLAWQTGPELPAARAESAAILAPDQSIHLFGGNNNTVSRIVSKLTTGSSSWTSAPGLDTSRFSPGVTRFGSNGILVIAGTGGGEASNEVLHYDHLFGDSQDVAKMLTPRRLFAFAADSFGESYAIGGLDQDDNELFSVEAYDANLDLWKSIVNLPEPSFSAAAVGDNNGNIFVFGGMSNGSLVDYAFCYTAIENAWIVLAPMPIAVRDSVAVFYNGLIYVLGGIAADGPVATVQVYNLATGLWSFDTDLPEPIYSHAAVVNSLEQIVVMGGYNINDIATPNVYRSQRLGTAETLPIITSSPILNTSLDQFYNYTVTAIGNPTPLFSLDFAPTGMTIDAADGIISWQPTPGQEGIEDVVVQASNRVGTVEQSFTINVATDTIAPTAPTVLQVDTVTTTTVDLSWTPASDANGVDHYNLYQTSKCGWRNSKTCYGLIMENIPHAYTTVTGLTPLSWFSYVVRAVDATGNISANSNRVSSRTLSEPTGLQYRFNGQLGGLVSVPAKTLLELDLVSSANPVANYSLLSGPQDIVLDQNTGHLQWLPSVADVGTHLIVVEASNTVGSSTLNIDITVSSDVPQLTVVINPNGGSPYSAVAGVPFTAQVSDSSNTQPISYSLISAPSGMTIDAATGFINWLSGASRGGQTNVTVQSTNSAGSTNLSFSFYTYFTGPVSNIQITNQTELLPTASWVPPIGVGENLIQGYSLVATAKYRYGSRSRTHTVSYDLPGTGTQIDLTGLVAGRNYKLSINAYDANGNRGLVNPVPVEVISRPDLPRITWTVDYGLGSTYAVVDQPLIIQLSDSNTTSSSSYSIVNAPVNLILDSVTGEIRWTPSVTDIGIVPITLRATNAIGSLDVVVNVNIPFSGPVQQLSAKTVSGSNTVSANWLAPGDNAVPVASYKITMHWTWSGRKRSRSWTTSATSAVFSLSPTGAVSHKGISIIPIDALGRFGVGTPLIPYNVAPAPAPTNRAPVAYAGVDQSIALPHTAVILNGSATDDGLPQGQLTYLWSVVSAPDIVSFGSPTQASTTASFISEGIYTLRLTVSDGLLSHQSDVIVTVNPEPVQVNTSPVANAGTDQALTLPVNSISLNGSATDDGLPSLPGQLTYQWSVVSAPDVVSFGNATQASTTVSFISEGVYTLRLVASDGLLSHQDDVIVTVNPAPVPVNISPVANAGADQVLTLPDDTINLNGSASDDGLPSSPGVLTYQWRVITAPGAVTFGNTNSIATTASFTVDGTYTLQLSVSDGILNDADIIVVTVNPEPVVSNTPPPYNSNGEIIELQGLIQEVGDNYLVVAGSKVWITSLTVKKFEDGEGSTFQVGQNVELKGSANDDGSISAGKIQVGG